LDWKGSKKWFSHFCRHPEQSEKRTINYRSYNCHRCQEQQSTVVPRAPVAANKCSIGQTGGHPVSVTAQPGPAELLKRIWQRETTRALKHELNKGPKPRTPKQLPETKQSSKLKYQPMSLTDQTVDKAWTDFCFTVTGVRNTATSPPRGALRQVVFHVCG